MSKNMGRSDQQIVTKGVLDCLLVKNWHLFRLEDTHVQSFNEPASQRLTDT